MRWKSTAGVLGWHLASEVLQDGRPLPPDGKKLTVSGSVEICRNGLHACRNLMDALQYGSNTKAICRVKLTGEVVEYKNKMAASERTILWRVDSARAHRTILRILCLCARDLIWHVPCVGKVRDYITDQAMGYQEAIPPRLTCEEEDSLRPMLVSLMRFAKGKSDFWRAEQSFHLLAHAYVRQARLAEKEAELVLRTRLKYCNALLEAALWQEHELEARGGKR